MRGATGLVCLLGAMLSPHPAAASDSLIEGARQCTQYFPTQERNYGIPNHLLAAISSTESGRWHDGLGMPLPWPWTINVEGRGYYFNSKAEAIARTAEFIRQGHKSIDVGCMQVNLMHHPYAFSNLDEAFDPKHNVEYAAKFLRDNYTDLGDWVKATAAYHSRTPVYGQQYLAQIEKSWNRIVSKVQQARSTEGLPPMAENKPQFSSGRAALGRSQLASVMPGDRGRMHPVASSHGVRVIEVREVASRRNNDVLVIHPQESAPIKVADATPTPAPQPAAAAVTVSVAPRSVSIDGAGRAIDSGAPASAPGTNFVFTN